MQQEDRSGKPTWHQLAPQGALDHLESSAAQGLSEAEAARRLAEHGPNELVERGGRGPLRILWEQLTATMVLILIAAAVLSGLLGDFKDAAAIGAIVILFALLGFVQEYRAEKAMAALKRLAVPQVRVTRGGQARPLSAGELVPGDVIALEAGNLVPADLRLLESVNLRIQEAALTGEAEAVEKETRALSGDLPLGDRRNMAYMGTTVTYGRGVGLVTATGMDTELGRIAAMLQSVGNEQTPLQKRLDQLGKLLAAVGVGMAGVIFALGLLRGEPLRDMLLTAVSIAVAIVPEGLPAVVTITLALGAQRMLRRQALIRRLPAVETLGSVTVICSDKTGTLTENRMTVMVLDVAGHSLNLSQTMRRHMPAFDAEPESAAEAPQALPADSPASLSLLLLGGALCNDALLKPDAASGRVRYHTLGDPTEGALLVAAALGGLMKDALDASFPRRAELPFDSERKRMTTVHAVPPDFAALPLSPAPPYIAFTKGAVDGLVAIASQVWVDGRVEPLTDEWRQRIQAANDRLAGEGMRVLGVAFRPAEILPAVVEEHDLTFVGLFGMIDPPRPEVKTAVQHCLSAGIRPVMITGDHPLTARQIAAELGISSDCRVLTGQELAALSDSELQSQVEAVSVFARVSPEHKLRIVQALQARGHIVAMTGDGVNDAPALKRADIGVAMGITGTDVTKEAAEMVLQDDNFATIVAAVEEGRTIFDNLRKFVKFSVAGNIGKVAVMLLGPLLGKPLPLEPLQLLWLNLLTDGLLGLGLGMEPPERDVMRRPPFSPKEGIFTPAVWRQVLWVGALIGALALGVGYFYWRADPNGPWQTMVFATLGFAQFFQALASRSASESLLRRGLFSNKSGAAIAGAAFLLQLAALYVPFLAAFLRTRPLALPDLALSLLLGALVLAAIEIEKALARR
jgi:Ca2+-transporting ATPase